MKPVPVGARPGMRQIRSSICKVRLDDLRHEIERLHRSFFLARSISQSLDLHSGQLVNRLGYSLHASENKHHAAALKVDCSRSQPFSDANQNTKKHAAMTGSSVSGVLPYRISLRQPTTLASRRSLRRKSPEAESIRRGPAVIGRRCVSRTTFLLTAEPQAPHPTGVGRFDLEF